MPRLLGVTKEAVLRLDEKTKEILKEWPLTTVRRWAASPNTFTLGTHRPQRARGLYGGGARAREREGQRATDDG